MIIFYVITGILGLWLIGSTLYYVLSEEFFERHPFMNLLAIPLSILGWGLFILIVAVPLALLDLYINPPFLLLVISALLWGFGTICGTVWLMVKIDQL